MLPSLSTAMKHIQSLIQQIRSPGLLVTGLVAMFFFFGFLFSGFLSTSVVRAETPDDKHQIDYTRDIQPILGKCIGCQ